MSNETYDVKEMKREQRAENLAGGVLLIVLGIVFLMGMAGVEFLGVSPWMIFPLLPVLGIGYAAWRRFEANGRRVDRQVVAMLTWGIFPFLFVGAAIFGFNPALIWPLALVFAGIGIIISR